MIEIKKNLEYYYHLFDTYDVFHNFIKYAVRDLSPQIFVDNQENPRCLVLYSNPAYFILGEPDETYNKDVCSLFHKNAWVIASTSAWKQVIEEIFKAGVITHPRVFFDSKNLNLDHILSHRKPLPQGLSIEPIGKKHIEVGMIFDDVVSRFFVESDFMTEGFGFALVDDHGTCLGFSLTNYPMVENEIELYFRVGYDSCPEYRSKGMGTTLCTYFIEEALKRGYDPVWDSANDTSTHIAKKLGYMTKKTWNMFHIL
jgi:GNAT superfamily N-acetyltransferase